MVIFVNLNFNGFIQIIMLYVLKNKDGELHSIWSSDCLDLEFKYKGFIKEQAVNRNIEINPNWLSIMNYDDWHTHLDRDDYRFQSKEWNKFLKVWTFEKFLELKTDAVRETYMTSFPNCV